MKQFPDPASTRQAVPRELQELYKHPLPSSRGGPLFNAFSYPTKISPEAVALYIATHTRPGATVLDAFAGSGTTIIAAEMSGRSCLAIELSPAYVDVAIKRWQDFTGEVATLEADGRSFAEVALGRLAVAEAA